MKTTLSPDDVTPTEPGLFFAEASDLRWPPGVFPMIVQAAPGFGNGQAFIETRRERNTDGDLQAVVYEQIAGATTIRVYND